MHGIKTLESRLRYSIVGYHRFIICHYPERLEDERPLFPMTVHDVCVYIDYKIQHCLYSSMQKHISVLQHHPDHGEWWKHQVLENLLVLKKMIHHRELEEAQTGSLHKVKKGEEEIEGFVSTESVDFLKEDDNDSDDNCMIVTGATKGFMITSAKPSIKKQVTMRSNSIMSYKKPILSSKKRHHRIEKPLSKQRKIKNGFHTVNMDVNEWANRVSIVPSVTPIALRPLPSIPRHTTRVTIETLPSSSSSFSTFSSPSPSLSIVPLSP